MRCKLIGPGNIDRKTYPRKVGQQLSELLDYCPNSLGLVDDGVCTDEPFKEEVPAILQVRQIIVIRPPLPNAVY